MIRSNFILVEIGTKGLLKASDCIKAIKHCFKIIPSKDDTIVDGRSELPDECRQRSACEGVSEDVASFVYCYLAQPSFTRTQNQHSAHEACWTSIFSSLAKAFLDV